MMPSGSQYEYHPMVPKEKGKVNQQETTKPESSILLYNSLGKHLYSSYLRTKNKNSPGIITGEAFSPRDERNFETNLLW